MLAGMCILISLIGKILSCCKIWLFLSLWSPLVRERRSFKQALVALQQHRSRAINAFKVVVWKIFESKPRPSSNPENDMAFKSTQKSPMAIQICFSESIECDENTPNGRFSIGNGWSSGTEIQDITNELFSREDRIAVVLESEKSVKWNDVSFQCDIYYFCLSSLLLTFETLSILKSKNVRFLFVQYRTCS